jgi:hypothetical protein
MGDSSVPPTSSMCYFFELLRELRDEIYEYVLRERKGLYSRFNAPNSPPTFKMFSSRRAVEDDTALESNQLKYVSRQLYNEAAGLGVKFNDLNFEHTYIPQSTPPHHLLEFINSCSPKRLDQLRQVTCRSHIRVGKAWNNQSASLAERAWENQSAYDAERNIRSKPRFRLINSAQLIRKQSSITADRLYLDLHPPHSICPHLAVISSSSVSSDK